MNKKYCSFCKKYITTTNFSEHKKTKKHVINMNKNDKENLLETDDKESDVKYIKLELEELKINIEKIIKNLDD